MRRPRITLEMAKKFHTEFMSGVPIVAVAKESGYHYQSLYKAFRNFRLPVGEREPQRDNRERLAKPTRYDLYIKYLLRG